MDTDTANKIETEKPPPGNVVVLIYSPSLGYVEWFPALRATHDKDGFICWIIYDVITEREVFLSEFDPVAWMPIFASERSFLVH